MSTCEGGARTWRHSIRSSAGCSPARIPRRGRMVLSYSPLARALQAVEAEGRKASRGIARIVALDSSL